MELQVDLEAGLGEGEEMGAETHLGLRSEDLAEEILECALEVGEGHAAIDVEPLELVEGAEVGRVDLVAAEGAAQGDDAHRRHFFLHRADLHGRGVGAQELAVFEIKGVGLIPRGVVGGRVERVEAMPLGLDLGPFGEGEAHAAEDADGFVEDEGEGMEPAFGERTGRQGRVDRGKGGRVAPGGEGGRLLLEGRGDRVANLVELLSDILFEIGGDVAHPGSGLGETALFPEESHAGLFQRRFIGDAADRGEGFGLYRIELG